MTSSRGLRRLRPPRQRSAPDLRPGLLSFPARGDAMDLAGLQQALLRLEALDPERQRALVLPSDDTSSTRVVALVDAIRSHRGQPLYPEVVLGGAELDRGSFGEDAP